MAMAVCISACSSTKNMKEGEYLLVKNEISSNRKDLPSESEMRYLIKPDANHRFLGIWPLRAAIYQSMLPKPDRKDRKWRQWFRNNLGEEPKFMDSSSVEYSCQQLRQYLYNKGFFETMVQSEILTHRKKAVVRYIITAEAPYLLNELSLQIGDTAIHHILTKTQEKSLLKKGTPYDANLLKAERNRIANLLADSGYYLFRPEHIVYHVDSNLNSHRFNLTINIGEENAASPNGAQAIQPFRKYYIGSINIRCSATEDTALENITHTEQYNNLPPYTYTLQVQKKLHYKPKALTYPLCFHPESRYSADAAKTTYNLYNSMQNFRFIRISYMATEESRNNPEADSGWLQCQIQLTPWEKHTLNFELLGKDIGSDYGVGVNLNLKNRNLFHSGEIQYDNILFSTEFQRNTDISEANEKVPMWRYRNFELGGEIGIHYPKMIFPWSQKLIPKKFQAQTRFAFGNYFQQRDHYSRFISNIGAEYEWKPSNRASHILKLLDISMVKIYKDSIFDRNLAAYSQRIREKYTNHFLMGANYKFLYNNASSDNRHNFYRLRINLNSYGNLLYGIFAISGAEKNSKGQYTIAGTPFTSFVSADVDFTYNIMLWERSSLVAHTATGMGLPTSNASTLPFERSFYLGGTNSMRAWNLRGLGPGSYHGTLSNFESSGDIKLECNLELRTPIYKNFFSAVFLDMGNIWNFRKNSEIPNGEFDLNRFYKELALDGGVGIRLDISFLVLRMDVATALYTPYLPEGERWRNQAVKWNDLRFRFGIGYPF